jgi:hypothetical protein
MTTVFLLLLVLSTTAALGTTTIDVLAMHTSMTFSNSSNVTASDSAEIRKQAFSSLSGDISSISPSDLDSLIKDHEKDSFKTTKPLNETTESTLSEQELAQRDLAYEYGKCVFYDRIPLEQCNAMAPEGLKFYEMYYGDGSWTVQADPAP